MNCSWLPYLTQRWCCERDHMRKGQIKNHGYSVTVKLCRYSPQVLLSLPTSISECSCLSEKKYNFLLQNVNLTSKLVFVKYFFIWFLVFWGFFSVLGENVRRKYLKNAEMHRQPAWYSPANIWNYNCVLFIKVNLSGIKLYIRFVVVHSNSHHQNVSIVINCNQFYFKLPALMSCSVHWAFQIGKEISGCSVNLLKTCISYKLLEVWNVCCET